MLNTPASFATGYTDGGRSVMAIAQSRRTAFEMDAEKLLADRRLTEAARVAIQAALSVTDPEFWLLAQHKMTDTVIRGFMGVTPVAAPARACPRCGGEADPIRFTTASKICDDCAA